MKRAECIEAFEYAQSILGENTFVVSHVRVLEVSEKLGSSGYDAEFVTLAEDLGTRLFTYDKKLLQTRSKFIRTP